MITKDKLQAFLDQGLSIIPLKKNKVPNLKSWQKYTKELYKLGEDVSEFESVGLVMGDMTHLSTIDIDSKYHIKGADGKTLFEKLKENVQAYSPGTWEKLTISTTKNGGYHLIYKIKEEKQKGSVKLAEREATEEEKKEGQTKLVLIETRTANSYVVCYPSEGYNIKQGKLLDVKYITTEERDMLYACSRMLSEVMPPVFKSHQKVEWQSNGETPWESYCNDDHHWKTVMEKNGWTLKNPKGTKIPVCRPGSKTPSGNFDTAYNLLRVFSTSQDSFSPDQSYNPFMIFCILEAGGDIKAGAKMLRDLNYGHTPEPRFKQKDPEVELDNSYEYMYDESEDENIYKLASGQLEVGKSTGYPALDEHFRHKKGYLNILGSHANLGKSWFTWNLLFAFCLRNDEKFIFYSPENKSWTIRFNLIRFLFGKDPSKLSKSEIKKGIDIINKHITFIESDEILSAYDIMDYADNILKKEKHYGLLIDPYNNLGMDFTKSDRKLSTYEYNYQVGRELKKFADTRKLTTWLTMHGNTSAQRDTHTEKDLKGLVKPLIASSLEWGAMWTNLAGDMLILHRYANKEELKNQTHIHVVKCKEEWSGGKRTMKDDPVVLTLWNGGKNFFGFYDINLSNPFLDYAKKLNIVQTNEKPKEDVSSIYESNNQEEIEYARGNTFRNVRPNLEEESDVPY